VDQQYWAWLNTEWNAGRLTRPGIALQDFRNHPRTFLKTYPLQNNYDPQNDGIFRAHIFNGAAGERPGSILKTKNMHTTESFTIQAAAGQLGEGHPFWLHGLHTGQSNLAPVWYLLDGGGPDIMLTAKLTGCTFIASGSLLKREADEPQVVLDQSNRRLRPYIRRGSGQNRKSPQ